MNDKSIEKAYGLAQEAYAEHGVDTEAALRTLSGVTLSLPCWQGDDVKGFEAREAGGGSGGIQATGGFPGAARTPEELRADLETALELLPGRHRVNLHAMYGEFGKAPADRDAVEPSHFAGWAAWARTLGAPLDFNATLFAHPRAASGFTLSAKDEATRAFWIEHVRRCREIAVTLGRGQEGPCLHNLWIPDGSKEAPADRAARRDLLKASLDEIYAVPHDPANLLDAVESKLFGIGAESFTTGSHEFYLGYAQAKGLLPCLDMGHFHPTESVADKISALLVFHREILLHLSRPVRWDSDHVTIFDDPTRETAIEVVRADALDRVWLALDFFDASIDRVGAWVIGARAVLKAFLSALLEPTARLRAFEDEDRLFERLALSEEAKALPLGAVWDMHCLRANAPTGYAWVEEVRRYEKDVLLRR